MRKRRRRNGISAHAISGTYVVTIGMNATEDARCGLLGFGIRRTDHTEDESYWLKGFKTFKSVEPNPVPRRLFSLRDHPVQSFLWADFTAKPNHDYTYEVVPMYGKPRKLEQGDPVRVRVSTESEDGGDHAVYFNRGVAGSQAYAEKFGNQKPDDVPNREAYIWLSRGLEEAMLAFIGQGDSADFGIRAAVYEFNYKPILEAFKAADRAGADVKIIFDARKEHPQEETERATRDVGIRKLLIPRSTNKSYISHNKFIVLLKNGTPVQVWTGSTNITRGGIFGQSNVGHLVRDPRIAKKYLDYWELLAQDPENRDLEPSVETMTPDPVGQPSRGTTAIFSPRTGLAALKWYADSLNKAKQTIALTAAFGINPILAQVLEGDKDYLRYLLLEKRGSNYDVYAADRDVLVSIGSHLEEDALYRWTKEKLTDFNLHVRYIHTKFMLIDPISDDPVIISGSANFSEASTTKNDENMLVIRGDARVADIYLGEFMRLFNHFYFRYHANRLRGLLTDEEQRERAFLTEDNSWTNRYYNPNSIKTKQRLLFA